MRFWTAALLCALLLPSVVRAGTPAKEEPKPKERPAKTRGVEPRAQNPLWLAALDRLRDAPQAGEIINVGVTANVADVFDVKDDEKAKIAALQEAYTKALLQKAAKWEDEMKALRADYEAQMAALLPEARRETARKLLDFSHTSWAAAYDWELKFNRDFVARSKEQPKPTTADEQKEVMRVMQAWMASRRDQQKKDEQAVLKTIRDMLTAEEAGRLEKFDRNRPAEPEKK